MNTTKLNQPHLCYSLPIVCSVFPSCFQASTHFHNEIPSFTNKANSHAFEVEIHTTQKLCHFGCYVAKVKVFCVKSFVPVGRAGVSIWKIFIPRDLGKPGQPGYLCEHIEIFTKERVKRRDLETEPAQRKSS